MSGGFTPPVGGGFGGGTKLPEVGGMLDGSGAAVGGGGGATKLPEVGGISAAPPVPPVPAATETPPSSVLADAPAPLGGGATKLPVVSGSRTHAAT